MIFISSAGVWHNFILVILAVACIQVHPIFVKTFFDNKVHIRNVIDVNFVIKIFLKNEFILKKIKI